MGASGAGGDYEIEQSLRFDAPNNSHLSRTFPAAGNLKTWTWSAWVKRGTFAGNQMLFSPTQNTNGIYFTADGILTVEYNSPNYYKQTSAKYRDTGAWYHIVVVWNTPSSTAEDRIQIWVNGERVTAFSGSSIPNQNRDSYINTAVEHNIGDRASDQDMGFDGYIGEVNFIDGQALTPDSFGTTGKYGEWKPTKYAGAYGTNGFYLPFEQDYSVEGFSTVVYEGNSSTSHYIGGVGFQPDFIWTKQRSGNYHLLIDSVRGAVNHLYSNQTQAERTSGSPNDGIVAFNPDGYTVGYKSGWGFSNNDNNSYVAWCWDMGANTPTGFAVNTYVGTGGNNYVGTGFSPDMVWFKVISEAGNHQLYDTVRGASSRLVPNATTAEATTSNGFAKFDLDGFTLDGGGGGGDVNTSGRSYVAWSWDMGGTTASNTDGTITSSVRANTTYGQSIITWTPSNNSGTVGHGLDSAPELWITKNRAATDNWLTFYTVVDDTLDYMLLNLTNAAGSSSLTLPTSTVFSNDGYTSSQNLVTYAFHSVTGYSKIGTYTGNGNSTGPTVTLGFRPAFVMIKRTDSTKSWFMTDNTRNPTGQVGKYNFANLNDGEYDYTRLNFTSTGFQLASTDDTINGNNNNYIYMAFAGGADAISDLNTDGTIDCRVKANPTYGQSIVSYTGNGSGGATLGHGLSSAPQLIIVKKRSQADEWKIYVEALGNTKALAFDTAVPIATAAYWNNTSPTSSVFSLGHGGHTNASGQTHIAYCFSDVTGYSKFGSYTGSGSSGKAITTGFTPAFVMVKRTDSVAEWVMVDNTRNPTNPANLILSANATSSEADFGTSNRNIDFDANGFTIKTTAAGGTTALNTSSGTYIYMAFADTREYAYWLDQSGNNNDWTSEGGLTESDVMVDSPTNNFATWNSLNLPAAAVLSEGNTKLTQTSNDRGGAGTMAISSGKFYFEIYYTAGSNPEIGLAPMSQNYANSGATNSTDKFLFISNNGGVRTPAWTATSTTGLSSQTGISVIGFAIDADAGKAWFTNASGTYFNSGNPATGSNPQATFDSDWLTQTGGGVVPFAGIYTGTGSDIRINFGSDSSFAGAKTPQGKQDSNDIGDFFHQPPSGYLALCSVNLPSVDVIPSENFNTVLYTGTRQNKVISGVGFQPDFIWLKTRSTASNHALVDSVRGGGKALQPNTTSYENQYGAQDDKVTAFSSDGFSLGVDAAGYGFNDNNSTYAAWNWKAGGSASSNTDGTITTQVSANPSAGFSIVSYTGNATNATKLGHGLSSAPTLVIVKSRTSAAPWKVGGSVIQSLYGDGTNNSAFLYLNTDAAADQHTTGFQGNTATTIQVGADSDTNASGKTYIAYAFHSVDGYSKVGSYVGNGNADGPFVNCGFRPAFVLWKRSDSAIEWNIMDSTRSTANPLGLDLYPNISNAEYDYGEIVDYLSNGFKFRNGTVLSNASGGKYLYLAFAETPFKFSNAR